MSCLPIIPLGLLQEAGQEECFKKFGSMYLLSHVGFKWMSHPIEEGMGFGRNGNPIVGSRLNFWPIEI